MLLPLQCRLDTNIFADCVELIGYSASALNVVPSNPGVGPLPRIKIHFPILSVCTDELISTPKMITFLPTLPSGKEYSPSESNPMPQPVYLYYLDQHF